MKLCVQRCKRAGFFSNLNRKVVVKQFNKIKKSQI